MPLSMSFINRRVNHTTPVNAGGTNGFLTGGMIRVNFWHERLHHLDVPFSVTHEQLVNGSWQRVRFQSFTSTQNLRHVSLLWSASTSHSHRVLITTSFATAFNIQSGSITF